MTPSSPINLSSLTADQVIELKYKLWEQLKEFKIYLTEKIPQKAEEYQKNIDQLQKILDDERQSNELKLGAFQQKFNSAEEANKLTADKLQFYKNAYEICTKADKRSFGCWVKKIFSFGGSKCH